MNPRSAARPRAARRPGHRRAALAAPPARPGPSIPPANPGQLHLRTDGGEHSPAQPTIARTPPPDHDNRPGSDTPDTRDTKSRQHESFSTEATASATAVVAKRENGEMSLL